MYDLIGDVHGHALTLIALLEKLGYTEKNNIYSHPDRKIIFVGDLIDRGSQIRKTLQVVKSMVETGNALSVMGNHEFNAICYHTRGKTKNFLRPHSKKNVEQHSKTLNEFHENYDELLYYINWFKTLPVFLELPEIRVVHACWDFKMIDYLKEILPDYKMTSDFMENAVKKETLQFLAIENILKGKEVPLPEGYFYIDKDGNKRHKIRIKWWIKRRDYSYRNLIVNEPANIPDVKVKKKDLAGWEPYPKTAKPVFFGHYWKRGIPKILSDNVCCLDYSIAKNHKLVAYRWSGEEKLSNNNFIWVNNLD